MGKRPLLSGFAGAGLLLLACAEEPNRPPIGGGNSGPVASTGSGGGSSADGGDGGAADGDAGGCTDLAPGGAVIDLLAVADDPPPGLGGAVGEGVYDIIDARVYVGPGSLPGPTNTSYQGTLRVSAQSLERAVVFRGANNSVQDRRVRGAFLPRPPNGNATIALTCPAEAQELVTFTVSGNNLIVVDDVSRVQLTFAKRL